MPLLHEDRLFPAEEGTRAIARRLYAHIHDLPLICPHGHTSAAWYADNDLFPNPTKLFIEPDHYVFRMLYSQGITLEELEIGQLKDPRKVWRIFASHYYLFRGTPTRLWLDYAFQTLFGLTERLSADTADLYYDTISEKLAQPEFRPRALFDRFRIEFLTTTNAPTDPLADHKKIRDSGWKARIVPTFRPDSVVDPEFPGFQKNLAELARITGEDTSTWKGYLHALRESRARFKAMGATATDHGHPSAHTETLSADAAAKLFGNILSGSSDAASAEIFRGQMLTEMARMSLEDGLVMQIHPGAVRDHNRAIFERYGQNMGGDIPRAANYVDELRPLLNEVGNERKLTIVLFTLDEASYSRELAPLAGHYPCLRLGPPWWFFDSPEGMMRFRETVTETAGFYNLAGFNDDTRAFLSIPARHDVARRVDCAYLARLVREHQLGEDEAAEVAEDLAVNLVRKVYRV